MANNTTYGLGGGLWTNNLQRAHRVAAAMRSGMVWINCYNIFDAALPFGGYKHSGIGRENGRITMEYYTQWKSVYVAKGNIDSPY